MLEGSTQHTSCSHPFCVMFYFKLFRNSHVAMDCVAYLCGRETEQGKLLFTTNMLSPSHDLNSTDYGLGSSKTTGIIPVNIGHPKTDIPNRRGKACFISQ